MFIIERLTYRVLTISEEMLLKARSQPIKIAKPVFEKILTGFSVSEEVKIKILRFYQKYC